VHHVRQGSGEPLLLVHGVGHNLEGWRPVAARLRERFEVVATDSPGFGRSAALELPPGREPDIEAYVDAYAAFLQEQGLDRPHAAGNSMGGGIVLELARRGLVRSACAISPVGFWTAGEARWCRTYLDAFHRWPVPLRPGLLRAAGSGAARRALMAVVFARADRYPADEVRPMLQMLWGSPAMSDVLRAMEDYRCAPGIDGVPLTIAWGDRDLLLPQWRQAPRARQVLPGARHVTLKGLGHTPMFDDPGRVAAVIEAAASVAHESAS
jgi:pimeloyl-ACP methyl ester carboxylesterase